MEIVKGYKDQVHTILMVGPPGSGKSTLAVNLFGKEVTVVIAYDRRGLKAVGEVDALLIDPARPWEDSIEALQVIQRSFSHKKCIVVNDATTMSRMLLFAEKPSRDARQPYAMAINKLRQFMLKLTTEFKDKHIIVECVDQLVRDEEDKVTYTAPNVIGKDTFALEFPGMFDHVFYVNMPDTATTIVDGKPVTRVSRTILTQSVKGKLAKNRVNVAGEPRILDISEPVTIEDGNFDNIEALRQKLLGPTPL